MGKNMFPNLGLTADEHESQIFFKQQRIDYDEEKRLGQRQNKFKLG